MRQKIIFVVMCFLLLANFAKGYEGPSPLDSANPMEAVNRITAPINNATAGAVSPNNLINAVNHVNWYGIFDFKGTPAPAPVQNPNLNLKEFFTPNDVSTGDVWPAVKAVLILVIQIFITVISVIAGILKLVLTAIK